MAPHTTRLPRGDAAKQLLELIVRRSKTVPREVCALQSEIERVRVNGDDLVAEAPPATIHVGLGSGFDVPLLRRTWKLWAGAKPARTNGKPVIRPVLDVGTSASFAGLIVAAEVGAAGATGRPWTLAAKPTGDSWNSRLSRLDPLRRKPKLRHTIRTAAIDHWRCWSCRGIHRRCCTTHRTLGECGHGCVSNSRRSRTLPRSQSRAAPYGKIASVWEGVAPGGAPALNEAADKSLGAFRVLFRQRRTRA